MLRAGPGAEVVGMTQKWSEDSFLERLNWNQQNLDIVRVEGSY